MVTSGNPWESLISSGQITRLSLDLGHRNKRSGYQPSAGHTESLSTINKIDESTTRQNNNDWVSAVRMTISGLSYVVVVKIIPLIINALRELL